MPQKYFRISGLLLFSISLLLSGCSGDTGDMTILDELEYPPYILGFDWNDDQLIDIYDYEGDTEISNADFLSGVTVSMRIMASDYNGDTISYALLETPPAWVALDAIENDLLNLTPGAGDVGAYSFEVEASDSTNLSSSVTISGNVVDSIELIGIDTDGNGEEDIPDLDNDNIADTNLDDITAGETVNIWLRATPLVGDPLVFSFSGPAPAWVTFDTLTKNMVTLSPQTGDEGVYTFTVEISAGGLTDYLVVNGTVIAAPGR